MPRKTCKFRLSRNLTKFDLVASRDDSNGEIRFVIRDLENKFWIFDRNYDFTIFPEIGNFSGLTETLWTFCDLTPQESDGAVFRCKE